MRQEPQGEIRQETRREIGQYSEQIYAGVLGKLLGVYMGRPVEGWFYDRIKQTFGEVWHYKNQEAGTPLIIPDDDLSGTFAFCRAAPDRGYPKDLAAEQIGEAWLDYLVENKTILWWGGLSRSTEHTAYIRLKNGIKAPQSGSMLLNGRSMAEQIGAEIFIDSWALMSPGDPELAVRLARQAGRVSHDGAAVEAACYIAALEAMAFEEKRLDILLDEGMRYVEHPELERLVSALRERCAKLPDWRQARDWIAAHHDYGRYPGNCPIQTNHLALLMALIYGGDDFHRSLMIATSAGWDTDCNAGNVGCLNGIRLGLTGIEDGADLRGPIADRLYLVTADGGSCVTDAVQVARDMLRGAAAFRGEIADAPSQRYAFEQPGSAQGFMLYPGVGLEQAAVSLENAWSSTGETGLRISYRQLAKGVKAAVCVETFVDNTPKARAGTSGFEVFASPTLYPTQTVELEAVCPQGAAYPSLTLAVEYFDGFDGLQTHYSEPFPLTAGNNRIRWRVPADCGQAIYRLVIELRGDRRLDGYVIIKTVDWAGAPENYVMGRSYEMTPNLVTWTNETIWLKTFVSSAENFYPDYLNTFSVSHPTQNGVATTGTGDWRDYTVASTITFSQQKMAGLVARARGHRQYYGAVLGDKKAKIIKNSHGVITVLAETDYPYQIDGRYRLSFALKGSRLDMLVDDERVLSAADDAYASGGAGFVVDEGAIVADGFSVSALGIVTK
ncbi:MAG: ADP-ribosylglycohydrolase family protein [Peptococcaceae bacterium]|jgi:ADP-ribosylglycohydrolase|nr:ADP-ribosylglycohydrolase family protein [Peptococcaceae bacterium]